MPQTPFLPLYGAAWNTLRRNPDRGFCPVLRFRPEQTVDPAQWLADARTDTPVLQITVCANNPGEQFLARLHALLSALQSTGQRTLLRFSFPDSTEEEQLRALLTPLGKWMRLHTGLLYETVTAFQLPPQKRTGLLLSPARKRALALWSEAVPPKLLLQAESAAARLIERNPPVGCCTENKNVRQMSAASFHSAPLSSGQTQESLLRDAAKKGLSAICDGEAAFSGWDESPLSAGQARQLGLPFLPEYFTDGAGNPISRSPKEYLCDHLGYQIAVTGFDASLPQPGSDLRTLSFRLYNAGFAAPLTLRRLLVCIEDENGRETFYAQSEYDPQQLKSGCAYTYRLVLPARILPLRVGLRLQNPLCEAACARFANRVTYTDGVNFLDELPPIQ